MLRPKTAASNFLGDPVKGNRCLATQESYVECYALWII